MINLTIRQMSELLSSKQVSVQQLSGLFYDRCKIHNESTGALVTLNNELDATELLQAQQQVKLGNQLLAGIPLIHKDLFCTQGIKTTSGSKMLENFVPPYDATVVKQLKAAGMVLSLIHI